MSEQNVWSCLLAYNGDAATTIFGRYRNTLALVLARLSSYPGKSKYHGHISGGAGDGEHAGAAENRTAAIEYLNAYTPPEEEKKVVNVANAAKASAGRAAESALLSVISNFSGTIPGLEAALTMENGNWRNMRNVNGSFEAWRSARKSKFKSQPKK
ncbi:MULTISPECIES: hypothetical protein [Pseudomonas]|uniref:hypothetical protein n=1 Tax=Pseudomonas TaxID=286 RepID=UPI001B33228E|nr:MULTISPECIES: hypothetical protein [Pseudomonas]MBP5970201.1 hypothetical protein [Pseudomonas iridis]UHC81981.1 hypothetical protein LS633_26945 [Pseudomonas sp. NIBR-H-19]